MKILHIADLHNKKEMLETCLANFKTLEKACEIEKPDLICLSGDFWDGPIQNSAGSKYPVFVKALGRLSKKVPIFMIYGTPTHDISGSLEIFEHFPNITILRAGKPYIYKQTLFLGIPEINKAFLYSSEEKNVTLDSFFFSLGLLRKKYENIPCVVLYHGQLRGAKLQNDQIIEGSEFIPRIDHFKLIDADYIAMGDIHKPQVFPEIKASYAGSAYPCNWSETHDAGFNIVIVEKGNSPVNERFSFNHPVNKKITVDLDKFDHTVLKELKNKNVWLELKAETGSTVKIEDFIEILRSEGALEGSKVTLDLKPIETMRSAEIREKKTLFEKIKVYAENSEIDVPSGTEEKIKILSKELKIKEKEHPAEWKLNKMVLRGAIGIKKGQNKDEIEINFDDYEKGLIALIGKNGAGKSTIIENMHPWPSLISRDGNLKDHFYLKDSKRELFYTDLISNTKYRILITINSAIASGKIEYFLYKEINGEWKKLEGINGRKDAYIEHIDTLFGSFSMFLRSAFVSQKSTKNNPDLADATAGMKKEIFAELSGISYLQEYSNLASAKGKENSDEINFIEGKISNKNELEKSIDEASKRIEKGKILMNQWNHEHKETKLHLTKVSNELEEVSKIENEKINLSTRKDSLTTDFNETNREATDLLNIKESYFKINLDIKNYGEIETMLKAELENERKYNESVLSAQKEHNNLIAVWQSKMDVLISNKTELNNKIYELERSKALLEKDLKPIQENCPTCNQTWPEEEKKKTEAENERIKEKIKSKEDESSIVFKEISDIKTKIALHENKKPETKEIPFYDKSRIEDLKAELEATPIKELREKLKKAEFAGKEIELLKKEIDKIEAEIKETDLKLEKIVLELGQKQPIDHLKQQKSTLEQQERQIKGNLDSGKAKFEELENIIKTYESQINSIKEHENKLETLKLDSVDWVFIKKACGKDGIQALELDALGPGIAEESNNLLKESYGSRFKISFETTRISGTGKKTKQIEDFKIMIYDNNSNTEQELSTLSGGEGVQIKRALYDAFGIIRARNRNIKFLTVFQDEADGALDPEAKINYFRMLEAAHNNSNRFHSVLITHSEGIQNMVSQKIILKKEKQNV